MKIRTVALALLLAGTPVLAACTSAAATANDNLDKAADNFEVPRRITGINGITDKVLFEVTGFCSVTKDNGDLFATCKEPDGSITRTGLVLSDNVTVLNTQISGAKVDLFHSRVILAPERLIPNFDLSTSGNP